MNEPIQMSPIFVANSPRKLATLGLAVWLLAGASPAQARTWQVPEVPLFAALSGAADGDRIVVRGGVHRGPIVVKRSVQLVGESWPILDGGGHGTVVTLAAPGAGLEGFVVRGSGSEPDQDHSGIAMTAARQRVAGNRLEDVLFGIFVARADDSLVVGNDVTSKPEFDSARKGDGIRLWYSQRVTVLDNNVHDARDLVAWYSEDMVMRGNTIRGGRYGIHFMYCNGAAVRDNLLEDNSVGIYTMYSKGMEVAGNRVYGCRGSSGYGLGFKDADVVNVHDNVLSHNRVGVFFDGGASDARFERNLVSFNDIALSLQPSARGLVFLANRFVENGEQVSVAGGGNALSNRFDGNYWSDYEGFDADRDGRGDVPYRSEKLFDNLADRMPELRFFSYTPAQRALDTAARLFPVVKPAPRMEDVSPLVVSDAPAGEWRFSFAGLALNAGLIAGALFVVRPRKRLVYA